MPKVTAPATTTNTNETAGTTGTGDNATGGPGDTAQSASSSSSSSAGAAEDNPFPSLLQEIIDEAKGHLSIIGTVRAEAEEVIAFLKGQRDEVNALKAALVKDAADFKETVAAAQTIREALQTELARLQAIREGAAAAGGVLPVVGVTLEQTEPGILQRVESALRALAHVSGHGATVTESVVAKLNEVPSPKAAPVAAVAAPADGQNGPHGHFDKLSAGSGEPAPAGSELPQS